MLVFPPSDFDECQFGTHDCHEDALCSATADGGYDCICKSGFEGDGRSCIGNSIINKGISFEDQLLFFLFSCIPRILIFSCLHSFDTLSLTW